MDFAERNKARAASGLGVESEEQVRVVEHPSLEEFEPLLDRVLQTACTSGLQALAQEGLRLEDIKTSASAHRRFLRGCHYGFDLAQGMVTKAVIDLDLKARELGAPQRTSPESVKGHLKLVRVIRNRQLILRRLIDSILWQILYPDERALRFLALDDCCLRVSVDRDRPDRSIVISRIGPS